MYKQYLEKKPHQLVFIGIFRESNNRVKAKLRPGWNQTSHACFPIRRTIHKHEHVKTVCVLYMCDHVITWA